MLLLTLLACAYSVENWWGDLADAYCECEQEGHVRTCKQQTLDDYLASEYGSCAEEVSPVERAEMKTWVRDYTENCRLPDEPMPQPENPAWFEECP